MSHSIIALEEKVAFLEKTVEDLDEVIRAMQSRLDHLAEAIEQLQQSASNDEENEEERFA